MSGAMDSPSPSWIQYALGVLATFLSGGVAHRLYNSWLRRRLPAAEVHESHARTAKTNAEARKINAEADTELQNVFERLHDRIDQMQLNVDEIRDERNALKGRTEAADIALQMRDTEIRRLRAILEIHGLQYDKVDFDD